MKLSEIINMCKEAKEKYGRTISIDFEFWYDRTDFRIYIESTPDRSMIREKFKTWNELLEFYNKYMEKEEINELPNTNS